jgi:hypothetical protein
MTGAGGFTKPAGGAAYVGPGDVQAASYYYALRAYTAATRGNKLANVCTTISSTDTCADMFSDATTGAMVLTVIGGAACNTGTQPYNIKTWYNLLGTGTDVIEATVASRAVLSACNGATTGANFGTGTYLSTSNTSAINQPFEIVWAASRTGAFTTQANVFDTASGLQDGYWTSTNTVYGFTGTVQTATASDSACHIIQIIHNGASGSITVDTTTTSSLNMGGTNITADQLGLNGAITARPATMTFYEGGIIASGSPTSLYSNIHGYGNC